MFSEGAPKQVRSCPQLYNPETLHVQRAEWGTQLKVRVSSVPVKNSPGTFLQFLFFVFTWNHERAIFSNESVYIQKTVWSALKVPRLASLETPARHFLSHQRAGRQGLTSNRVVGPHTLSGASTPGFLPLETLIMIFEKSGGGWNCSITLHKLRTSVTVCPTELLTGTKTL